MVPPADYVPAANPQSFDQYDTYVSAAITGLAPTLKEWSPKAVALVAQHAHMIAEAAINEQIRRNQRDWSAWYDNMY